MAEYKRVTIFCGHYGSGKTNLAVNYALQMRREGLSVRIADLDIVNPYFRTKDSAAELEAAGIPLISPRYANSNVDLPALPQELYSLVQQRDRYAVMDVGGDDRGAYALGRYTPFILEENNFEMICVVNFFRPLTETAEEALEVMREIEGASHLPFTAIINNSNLGNDTTPEDVMGTMAETEKLSEMTGLPILLTSVNHTIRADVKGENIFPLTLQKKYYDLEEF